MSTVNDVNPPRCEGCQQALTTKDALNRRIDFGIDWCDACIAEEEANECLCSYGYFLGGDPRQFVPDEEMNTPEEIERWKVLCAAWELGETPAPAPAPAPEEHGPWIEQDGTVTLGVRPSETAIGVCHAPRSLGLGTTYCQEHVIPAGAWRKAAPMTPPTRPGRSVGGRWGGWGMLWFLAYIGSIVAANATLVSFGLIPVGFSLLAPAGVLWAGLSLTLRDLLQDSAGRSWTIAAILFGAFGSWFVAPSFALASGLAFLVSELSDFMVYTPIRERHWLTAVLLSNTVGLVVDSALFLWLAFGSLDFLAGQVWAKFAVTLATVAVLWAWRQRRASWRYAH